MARTWADRCGRYSLYGCGIEFLLAAIAVDHGTGNILDGRSKSSRDCSPA
jgi:hypothetical protein